jgi:hypothetical protein
MPSWLSMRLGAAADHYERVSYRRIPVTVESVRAAWVYVRREEEL